jgi:hypothetical protein
LSANQPSQIRRSPHRGQRFRAPRRRTLGEPTSSSSGSPPAPGSGARGSSDAYGFGDDEMAADLVQLS